MQPGRRRAPREEGGGGSHRPDRRGGQGLGAHAGGSHREVHKALEGAGLRAPPVIRRHGPRRRHRDCGGGPDLLAADGGTGAGARGRGGADRGGSEEHTNPARSPWWR